jgi:hypothetical protein
MVSLTNPPCHIASASGRKRAQRLHLRKSTLAHSFLRQTIEFLRHEREVDCLLENPFKTLVR